MESPTNSLNLKIARKYENLTEKMKNCPGKWKDEKLHFGNFSVLGSPECLGILKLCAKSVSEIAFSRVLDNGNLKDPEEFEGSS